MIANSGYLTAESILELKSLIQKITTNPIFKIGLSCQGKKKTLEHYISSIANLMIMCSSFFQSMGYIKDINTLNYRFGLVKNIYKNGSSKELYLNPYISSKMVRLYEMVQREIENFIFDEIENNYKNFKNKDNRELLEFVLDELYVLAEISALHLAGQRINCFNIKDEIFKDTEFEHNDEIRNHTKELKSQCQFLNKDYDNTKKKECLHLFMLPQYFISDLLILKYFKIYYKYHRHPENITIVLDYKLMKFHVWGDMDFKIYDYSKELFHNIYIINHEDVDFSTFKNHKLNLLKYDELPEFAYC